MISLSLETAGTVAWGLGCMSMEDRFFFFTFFGIPGAGKIKQMYTEAYIMKSSENCITKSFKLQVFLIESLLCALWFLFKKNIVKLEKQKSLSNMKRNFSTKNGQKKE